MEDIAQLLARGDHKAQMQKSMGYSLGRAVDVRLAALAQNFSQIVGTLGVELTFDNFLRAVQYVREAGYVMGRDMHWVLSTAQEIGLLKMDTFVHADYVGGDAARSAHESASIGRFQGAPVLSSNLVRSPATGQHESFLLHKETVALIMAQNPKTSTDRIALDLADVVVQDQVLGAAEVNRYSETPGNITATDEGSVLLQSI